MDIIDTAAEIEELQRNAALSAHRIDVMPYQLSVALNATNQFPNRGALLFLAARRARIARASSN
ncbi:C4-type zinc finger protein [Enterobacter asburiae]|nr:C4-type zinc finger protein [Enterobacter asburiae]